MTIFDSDLRSVAPQELEHCAVDYTIADGTVVFQR
jgi:predicted amidohydrolase YtcJ